jgi:hypothetical protein
VLVHDPADLMNIQLLTIRDLGQSVPHCRFEPHAGSMTINQYILA